MIQAQKLLIAIPTYNERGNVNLVYQEIKCHVPEAHLLFIDDNSPDGTGLLIDELIRNDKTVHVLHRPAKSGLGTAHCAAFRYARDNDYNAVLTMDADLTHDPKYIPAMLERHDQADIVIGSRYTQGAQMINWGAVRLPFTIFWRGMIRYGLGMPYDCTGAFRLYSVTILDPVVIKRFNSKGFSFNLEALYYFKKQGARIAEVPIQARSRTHGHSKLSVSIMREVAKYYCILLADRLRTTLRRRS